MSSVNSKQQKPFAAPVATDEEPPKLRNHRGEWDRLTDYRLAQLVPPVMVAWADGGVDESEREQILQIAARGGVKEGTAAYRWLLEWLEEKPALELYEEAARIINQKLRLRPRHEAAALASVLHERTSSVAMVSRSYWGLGPRVSPGEQEMVERFWKEIDQFTFPLEQS